MYLIYIPDSPVAANSAEMAELAAPFGPSVLPCRDNPPDDTTVVSLRQPFRFPPLLQKSPFISVGSASSRDGSPTLLLAS